jgi:hypothetical protein
LRWKEIFNQSKGGSKEFIFGYAELEAGQRLPLHAHKQAETDFIISGNTKVRSGKRIVEAGPAPSSLFQMFTIPCIIMMALKYIMPCQFVESFMWVNQKWMPTRVWLSICKVVSFMALMPLVPNLFACIGCTGMNLQERTITGTRLRIFTLRCVAKNECEGKRK